jgi:hypothetical protein
MTGSAGGQQRAAQARCRGGEGVDALVQIPVGRRQPDPVIPGQLRQPGAIDKPAQHQYHLSVTAQRPPASSGPSPAPLHGQPPGQEQHGLLPDGEDGGVADKI